MSKLPAIQFYPGDWKKDAGVQSLSFHDRGVWFEILLLMHESPERGKLLLGGKAMPQEALSRLLGLDNQILTTTLTTLKEYGVVSVCETTGALCSRRMIRDEHLRQIRADAGKKGGNPALVNQKTTTGDNQNLTPSSSSSSSSSLNNIEGQTSEIRIPDSLNDKQCIESAEKWFAYMDSKGLQDKNPRWNEPSLQAWWGQMAKLGRDGFIEAVEQSMAAQRWNVELREPQSGRARKLESKEWIAALKAAKAHPNDWEKRQKILDPDVFEALKRTGSKAVAFGTDFELKTLRELFESNLKDIRNGIKTSN